MRARRRGTLSVSCPMSFLSTFLAGTSGLDLLKFAASVFDTQMADARSVPMRASLSHRNTFAFSFDAANVSGCFSLRHIQRGMRRVSRQCHRTYRFQGMRQQHPIRLTPRLLLHRCLQLSMRRHHRRHSRLTDRRPHQGRPL